MIKIKGGRPDETKFKSDKIYYVGKMKIKEPTPSEGLYPKNDLYPANDLFPTNEG